MSSKEYQREYKRKNPEKIKKYQRDWAKRNKKKVQAKHEIWRKKYPEKVREWSKLNSQKLRKAALEAYSGKYPRCACCGEDEYDFLVIDHIEGGGGKHRKQSSVKGQFYRWLKRNNYPEGFQVLCHNCNMAKGLYGSCPHKSVKP